ncbi:MAG: RluA family pseudouridine synthase [Mariprofundaceae bacterium]
MNRFSDVRFSITEEDAGRRLDQVLADKAGLSRRRIRRAIDDGGVYVNRKRCRKAGLICRAGSVLRLVMLDDECLKPLRDKQILWHKDGLTLIHKYAGQYAQEALHRSRGTIPVELAAMLGLSPVQARLLRPVHRLDRGTSGLMLLCWQPELLNHLQKHWRDCVNKQYLAVVSPLPDWQRQRLRQPISAVRDTGGRYAVDEHKGRTCDSEAEVLETRQNRALLRLTPHTGRTHQLRVHLAHAGHPILGDRRYGGASHARMMLHAHGLCVHPPALPAEMDWQVEPDEENWTW